MNSGASAAFDLTLAEEGLMKARFALRPIAVAVCAAALLPLSAAATDGYFSHGYGMRAKGMGGATFSLALDSMGGANNPAGMAFVGTRIDVGVDWFSPQRSASRSGAAPGLNGSVDSDSTNFFVPEFGYNYMLKSDLALGVTLYGNGGMNTDYPGGQLNCGMGPNTANMLCGNGTLGQDLSQLIVAPTLAWKFAPTHSLGISPLFDNAPGFPPFTSAPGYVTNNGYDSSSGWGVRVGYQGEFDGFRLGAVYSSKMQMSSFDKYKGLFAEQGGFDIPASYGIGVAFTGLKDWTFAFDWLYIDYGDVPSISNPGMTGAPLGANNGPGFGWQSVNVYKIGVEYQLDPAWTLRAGYNYSENPIDSANVTFNIIAPGVVQQHLTLGFSYNMPDKSSITVAYMHAFKNTVTGSSMFNAILGPGAGGTETISMYENSLGIAWGKQF
jgi:long-chain fatty acid transport protein